jgi:hypothetical protein
VGDEHPDQHSPELNVDSAAAPRLEPDAASVREVDPDWAPPLAASRTSRDSGLPGGIWILAALTTLVGIGIEVAVTLQLSHGGRSAQRQAPAAPAEPPTVAVPSTGVNAVPAPSPAPGVAPDARAPVAVEPPTNPLGYVQIGTRSGKMRCDIMRDWVGCETSETNWPMIGGSRAHDAKVTDGGEFHWLVANLGRMQYQVTLDYQTYRAMGWTIQATPSGTTFTNDRTGHGMSVNIESASSFCQNRIQTH